MVEKIKTLKMKRTKEQWTIFILSILLLLFVVPSFVLFLDYQRPKDISIKEDGNVSIFIISNNLKTNFIQVTCPNNEIHKLNYEEVQKGNITNYNLELNNRVLLKECIAKRIYR